ncbi:TPA: Ig-like domain-containing protein, partial [Providencia alcalifaciens]
GNPVPNVDVVFTAANGGLPATQTVTTNASGEARFDVTNTTAGQTEVSVYLQSSGNSTAVSRYVTFIAGKPVVSLSVLSTNSGSYTAGDEIIVSAVLKDTQGNAVSGETDLLNDSYAVLNVQGAERKTGSVWAESSTKGTYRVIYTAVTAGTGLKATVKLADWTAVVESAAYAIEADASSAMISASVLDNGKKLTPADGITTYDVKILVNDRYGNIVKLYSVTLTSPVLTNPKTVSTSDDGSVTTSISSAIAGSNDVTITSSTNTSVDEVRVTLKYSISRINVSNPLP